MLVKNYFKKLTSIILTAAIIYSSTPIFAFNATTLKVDGIPYDLQVSPVIEEDVTLVGLREIFEILGANVDWNEETGEIVAKTEDMTVKLTLGIKVAEKNGTVVDLAIPPKQINGNTMVPLRFVGEAFGSEIIWNSDNHTITMNTNMEEPIEEPKTIDYPALTIDNDEPTITYEEAVKKALDNSLALKNIEENIKIAEEQQEDARSAVVVNRPPTNDYTSPEAVFVADASHIVSLIASIQADYGAKAAKYQKEIQEGVIRYQVRAGFDSIQGLKRDTAVLSKSVELSEIQLNIVRQKAQLGMESEFNKNKAEEEYSVQLKQLDSLKKSLDNEYIKINKIIGINENEKYSLEYDLEFIPIELDEPKLNAYIQRSLVNDPSILLKKEEVRLAEYNLHLYTGDTMTNDSYDIRKSRLQQAINEERLAKDNLSEKIRITYNQIKQLEEQYEMDQSALKQAQEQYKILKTQYDLGMIIEANLKQGELALLSAQANLEKTIINHEKLTYLFNNPFLL